MVGAGLLVLPGEMTFGPIQDRLFPLRMLFFLPFQIIILGLGLDLRVCVIRSRGALSSEILNARTKLLELLLNYKCQTCE